MHTRLDWTGLLKLKQQQSTHPNIQVPGVARAVAINGTCVLVKVLASQPAWWGEQLVVKLVIGRGGGGGTGSGEASWGTSGPVRITGRELMSMATPRKTGRMQSLKRIDPESHAFAWRRGSDGAELVIMVTVLYNYK